MMMSSLTAVSLRVHSKLYGKEHAHGILKKKDGKCCSDGRSVSPRKYSGVCVSKRVLCQFPHHFRLHVNLLKARFYCSETNHTTDVTPRTATQLHYITHSHTHTRTHTHTLTHTHSRTHTHPRARTHTHTLTHARTLERGILNKSY
jgi:hypothetical protein